MIKCKIIKFIVTSMWISIHFHGKIYLNIIICLSGFSGIGILIENIHVTLY